jgi:hypothetical protein
VIHGDDPARILRKLDGTGRRGYDGIELGDLGVDPADRTLRLVRDPDRCVGILDRLRRIALGCDSNRCDQGHDHDADTRGGRPRATAPPPPPPNSRQEALAHFSALAGPARPARVTATVMQTGAVPSAAAVKPVAR